MIAVILLPLENNFPTVAGMSFGFFIFAAIAAYVILNRPGNLGTVLFHPLFIAAYAFIVVSALLEFSSPLSYYLDIFRFAQMIGGAVFLAVLCRDRSAFAAGLYGYIATGLWVSVVLYLTGYGTLQGSVAEDFDEASKLREQAFDKPMGANINALAGWCTQGAIVAFSLSLSDRLKHLHTPLLGVAIFCLVASLLPMSRGIAAMSLVSFAVIFYARGFRYGKALILACLLGTIVYMVVPNAVWSRMVYSTEVRDGRMEARASLYTTVLNRLPEYIVSGVGAGNFYNDWGVKKGFLRKGNVIGVHNSFLQIAINWGVLGLTMFLWIIWRVYRSLPLQCGRDELSLALLGILVSLGIYLLQIHNFYDKSFAIGLGMLVGARLWIWPRGIVSEVVRNKCEPGAGINTRSDCHSR